MKSITNLFFVALFTIGNCLKTPYPMTIEYNGDRINFMYGTVVPDSCPDTCIYTRECENPDLVKGDTDERVAAGATYFTNALGECVRAFAVDFDKCKKRDIHECTAECGGLICTDPNETPMVSERYVLAFRELSKDGVKYNFFEQEWKDVYNERQKKLGRPTL